MSVRVCDHLSNIKLHFQTLQNTEYEHIFVHSIVTQNIHLY